MLQELTNKIKKIIPEIEEEMEEQEQITEQAGDFIRQSQRPSGKTNVYERDINLEDVLRCLAKNSDGYFVDCKGRVNNLYDDKGRGDFDEDFYYCDWHLDKPLHEQSEETIKELNKLIN